MSSEALHRSERVSTRSLRERKKRKTRDALCEAARRLALERGFEHVTIEQIAAEADVSRRTFFRYFPGKEAVFFLHHARHRTRFDELMCAARPDEEPFARVRRSFLALAADYMREREEIVPLQELIDASPALIAYERRLDREWDRDVALALESSPARRGRTNRDARLLAGATMGAIRATLREWFDAQGRMDLVALGRETFARLAPLGAAMRAARSAPRRHGGEASR